MLAGLHRCDIARLFGRGIRCNNPSRTLAQSARILFYRAMPLDLTLFNKLQALPRVQCRWRTRPTQEGWEAQCEAGTTDDSLIVWLSKGDTEQHALNRAVDDAWDYWAWRLKADGFPE